MEAHDKWEQWSLGNHTCHNIQRQSHIHTQNSEFTACSCTQKNHKVQKHVQGGYRVHSLALKFDSHRYLRKKNRASRFFITLYHLHVYTPPNPCYHLPYCANKGACVKARASQFSSSHACHSLWQGLSLHMQVITISWLVPHDQQANWITERWFLRVRPKWDIQCDSLVLFSWLIKMVHVQTKA